MVRLEEGNQREELFAMWQRIFHDTTPYTQFYFNEVYGRNEILLEEDGDVLRGMLHLNPYRMNVGEDLVDVNYIVGVSTEEEYRRQGVMRNLLQETFSRLRSGKEPFTYLMPADEAYYLPFSFRFGMVQYEQEMEPGQLEPKECGYEVCRWSQISYEEYAKLENEYRKSTYKLSTEVSAEYFRRLQEEVASEFGCFFFVKKNGLPLGRFVAYAEDDFMAISQMECYDSDLRDEFLQQVIQFCHERYHFRQYRITYSQAWKENLLSSCSFDHIRVFQTRTNPIIMFRILNLELLGPWMKSRSKTSCQLKVLDPQIPDQEGTYSFDMEESVCSIRRIPDNETVDGVISIADLTSKIFGDLDHGEAPKTFNDKARAFWDNLIPFEPIQISEIV